MPVSGDTFVPFYGEFLVSPIPLELSFNFCSHVCAYCFANLNKPNRRADIKATMNMLSTFRQRNTLVATLLKEGYPVLISNRVDPFANSNYRQTIPVMEVMIDLNIPITIQTKGGKGINQILDKLKSPTVFYITIESDQDAIAKRIAPGAPSISERFELIELLRSKGHPVVVGWNPTVTDWVKDPTTHIQRLAKSGVHGVWLQELHFNTNQTRQLKPKDIQSLTPELIQRSSQKTIHPTDADYLEEMADQVEANGMHPFLMFQSRKSGYFDVFHDCYEKTFPTMQGVVNNCHNALKPGDILTIEAWLSLADYMPKGIHQIGHYVCSTNYSLCKAIAEERGRKWNHNMSYTDLLTLSWNDSRVKFNPGRNLGMQYAITPEGEYWVDENDHHIMVWTKADSLEWDYVIERF